ncbi:MAG: alpha/beta hydrolase, partial [Ktedonobacteraceae bacterium]|nr:alpha/beta hydrolase [Ktedonobacteraceae bacterium]
DVVARIAPRPILFIHGDADDYVPTSNMFVLANAARSGPDAHAQTWLVHGAKHARSFVNNKAEYVARVVAFYNAELGSARGTA